MEELVVECVGGETIELGEEGNVDGVGDDTGQGTHETLHLPNWCEEDENWGKRCKSGVVWLCGGWGRGFQHSPRVSYSRRIKAHMMDK